MAQHTIEDILKAAEKLDGAAKTTSGPIIVTVRPGAFVSDGRGNYTKGQVVRGISAGKRFIEAHVVKAVLDYYGVADKVNPAVLAQSFALPGDK